MNRAAQIEPISQSAVESNSQVLRRLRHLVALVLGVVAGVWQLESLQGFALYGVGVVATSLLLFIFVGAAPAKYVSGPFNLATTGVVPALAGYLLTWVVTYSIIDH